jgi:hypothetical protein
MDQIYSKLDELLPPSILQLGSAVEIPSISNALEYKEHVRIPYPTE